MIVEFASFVCILFSILFGLSLEVHGDYQQMKAIVEVVKMES